MWLNNIYIKVIDLGVLVRLILVIKVNIWEETLFSVLEEIGS